MTPIMRICELLKGLNSGQGWSIVFAICAIFAGVLGCYGLVLVCLVFALVWWFVVSDNYEEEE